MSGKRKSDAEELQEVLKAVSEEIPALIKGIMGSVFSGEAGTNMGRAAANFYKELKEAGIPDDVAVRMTENYVETFTDLGSMIKEAVSKQGGFPFRHGGKHGRDKGKKIREEPQEQSEEETKEEEE